MAEYARALALATRAAWEAGAILRAAFHQPGGPGGETGHAPADEVAEWRIGEILIAGFPDWGWLSEEATWPFRAPQDALAHLWLVDPNDATRAFQEGYRGSAVSIALLRGGEPVLGVVYAYAAPDDDGDLIAWAEGTGPLRRNDQSVEPGPWPGALEPETVVLVSHTAQRRPTANQRCVAPGRFRAVPSIAYRLALAAAGDGAAAVSLGGCVGWDFAGGHALLRSRGGVLLDETGSAIRYSVTGHSGAHHVFGGAPKIAAILVQRPWVDVFRHEPAAPSPLGDLVRLAPGEAVGDAGRLRRAQGALLGQVAGDALGSLVEFSPPVAIRRHYPGGVRQLADRGPLSPWNTLAGQPTDDSELVLALARTLDAWGGYDAEAVARTYAAWLASDPFDVGGTTREAFRGIGPGVAGGGSAAAAARAAANPDSQANGALMRCSPLGIWGARQLSVAVAAAAREDSQLSHPHPTCVDASALYAVTLARAIATGEPPEALYRWVRDWAASECRAAPVRAALENAATSPPKDYLTNQGWVLVALQNAFYQLLHASSLEQGVVDTVMAGGDSDTNAAIAGALLGAVYGRDAVPFQWRQAVLTCRPLAGVTGIHHPRPRALWPVDALELAERLLLAGAREG